MAGGVYLPQSPFENLVGRRNVEGKQRLFDVNRDACLRIYCAEEAGVEVRMICCRCSTYYTSAMAPGVSI